VVEEGKAVSAFGLDEARNLVNFREDLACFEASPSDSALQRRWTSTVLPLRARDAEPIT